MQKIDTFVTDQLVVELLQPERLRDASLAVGSAIRAAEFTTAQDKLKRLYTTVEAGMTDLDDILRKRLAALKLARGRAKAALVRI